MLTERFGSSFLHLLVQKLLANKALVRAILLRGGFAIALLTVGISPAQAEALKDWQYDAQTRSLTLTLPDSVVPLISVVSSDQLILELPDTQVGDVMGQSIRDGLVESIVVEQATPETVWVVMDFETGVVLADSQDATLLAETDGGDRQWQVRPALVAASRRAASQSVASADIPPESAASVLRTPASAIAQSSDFPELPVLEPAMPMNEPVAVPPLNARPLPTNNAVTPAVVVPPLEEATASAPALSTPATRVPDRLSEENLPIFEVEVIPAEPPVAIEIEPVVPAFLDEFEDDSQPVPVQPFPDEFPDELPNELPNEPPVAVQPLPDEIIATGNDAIAPFPTAPATAVPVTIEPVAVPVIESIEPEPSPPSNVSRWPEPIPFGQPLPR